MGNAGHILGIVGNLELTLGVHERQPAESNGDQYRAYDARDGPLVSLLRRDFPNRQQPLLFREHAGENVPARDP